jgi:hypothetical protein
MVKQIFSLALLALVSASPLPDVDNFPEYQEFALAKGIGGARGLGRGLGGGKLGGSSCQPLSHEITDIDKP